MLILGFQCPNMRLFGKFNEDNMGKISSIAGFVVLFLFQALLGAANKIPDRSEATVSLGNPLSLKLRGTTPYTDFEVVFEKNRSFWAFTTMCDTNCGIAAAYFDGLAWTPPERITPSHKSLRFWPMTACADAAGCPIVFWSARVDDKGNICSDDDIRGQPCIYSTHYRAKKWSKPQIIAKQDAGTSIYNITTCRDPNGHVHLVYVGEMSPPEEYSIGILVVDGASANKLFHMFYDGKNWSAPKPTTPRGRFSVDTPKLTVSTLGTLFLSATISPFTRLTGHMNSYVAFQEGHGGKWTGMKRLTPPHVNLYGGGQAVIDGDGFKHMWWSEDVVKIKYGRIENGRLTAVRTLEKEGMDPSMTADSQGRVYLCWDFKETKLSVWDGKAWSKPISVPISGRHLVPKLVTSLNGQVFIAYMDHERLVIREITVDTSP
jgi:hypothetical protein